jgi:hypothetical protein
MQLHPDRYRRVRPLLQRGRGRWRRRRPHAVRTQVTTVDPLRPDRSTTRAEAIAFGGPLRPSPSKSAKALASRRTSTSFGGSDCFEPCPSSRPEPSSKSAPWIPPASPSAAPTVSGRRKPRRCPTSPAGRRRRHVEERSTTAIFAAAAGTVVATAIGNTRNSVRAAVRQSVFFGG